MYNRIHCYINLEIFVITFTNISNIFNKNEKKKEN